MHNHLHRIEENFTKINQREIKRKTKEDEIQKQAICKDEKPAKVKLTN